MNGPSPLLLEGWSEFNRVRWGVTPVRHRYCATPGRLPALDATIFLDRNRRMTLPPGSPYLALHFHHTPTNSEPRRHRQWLEVAELLLTDMHRRGVRNTLVLPPDVIDARLWQWGGYRVEVRYTFILDFPFRDAALDGAVRQNVQKATRAGFRCERVATADVVHSCLRESERRQGFSYRLTASDLGLARQLVGEEHLRFYVCYAPDGQPAAAQVALHREGSRALLWLAGTPTAFLQSCATQFLFRHVLSDLESAGATGCDYTGANVPSVALQKSKWGGRLVPYYTLEAPDLKGLARFMRNAWTFKRKEPLLSLKGF